MRAVELDALEAAGLRRRAAALHAPFRPVDGASLAVFRVAFGALILWDVWRYVSRDWIRLQFLEPAYLFPFPGFEWVRPWPGDGLFWHFAALGALALLVSAGLFYRAAVAGLFVAFAYVFLLDQALYLNHFYLALLLALLLCFVPAARCWSLDALLRPRGRTVPAWSVWVLRFQFEVVLLFAGLVKLDGDWLFRLEPMRTWLAERGTDLPLVGPFVETDAVVALAAWGAVALHLVGAPLLLWRRTRFAVFCVYCVFHALNAALFEIGIFPWLTIAGTTLFFAPDWPRRLLGRLAGAGRAGQAEPPTPGFFSPSPLRRGLVVGTLGAYAAAQVLLPLRHLLLFPTGGGGVAWHEQGHRFSWRMKLRDKRGLALFAVRDPRTGEEWRVDPVDDGFIGANQARVMAGRPEMVVLFARHLRQLWAERGVDGAEVRARVMVSLNRRPRALLVDPGRDLAAARISPFGHDDWILPLGDGTEEPPGSAGPTAEAAAGAGAP